MSFERRPSHARVRAVAPVDRGDAANPDTREGSEHQPNPPVQGSQQSKGGIPKPPTVEDLLARSDADLASLVIGMMCTRPRPQNFEALGRVLRAGAIANREDLAAALRRPLR